MSILFTDPGTDDTHDLSRYTTSGTAASATDQARTGARSIKLSTGSPAVTAFAEAAGVLANTGRRISFWYRFDATPAASMNLLNINAAGSAMMAIQLTTANKLQFTAPVVSVVLGTTVLSANTWYRICLSYYVTNSTTWTFKIYLNGSIEVTANSGTLTNSTASAARFSMASTGGTNRNSWFDDIYIDDGASSSSQPDTGDIFWWVLPAAMHARRQRVAA